MRLTRISSLLLVLLITAGVFPAGAQGAFPGANGKLVVSQGESITLVNPDGSSSERVVREGVGGELSPDGRYVLYTRFRRRGADVYIKDLDTGRSRRVADTRRDEVGSSFTADGRRVLYTLNPGRERPEVLSVRLNGTGKRVLTPGDLRGQGPVGASDGSVFYLGQGQGIVRLGPNGSRQKVVGLSDLSGSSTYDVTPDARAVIYSAHDGLGGCCRLVLTAVDGTGSRDLPTGPITGPGSPFIGYPVISPDGTAVIYLARRSIVGGGLTQFDETRLLRLDGSGESVIPVDSPSDWGPVL